jgi:hypothetical protein
MPFVNSWNLLWGTHVFGTIAGAPDRSTVVLPVDRQKLLPLALAVQTECLALGLKTSWASGGRIAKLCETEGATAGQFADQCSEFFSRLADEMVATPLYAVAPDRAGMIETPNLFGAAVAASFPQAIFDIEEAGKCLAFERGTACAFHLMRVMEVGLRHLAKELGITYAPSWESYITQINARIAGKHKQKGVRWKRDEPYFTEILGDLVTVKVAWRNPTMHVRRKYTPEEATDMFGAVKTLLRRMADRVTAKAKEKAQ